MYDVPAREQSLRDYWHILQKRKWTVVVSIVVVFVVAGIISVRMTPIYDGVTIITIFPRASIHSTSKTVITPKAMERSAVGSLHAGEDP